MSKVKIFVESKGDRKFLQDYISYKFNQQISSDDFLELDGDKSKLEKVKNKFIEYTDQGYTNILFLDANSSYDDTLRYINKFRNTNDLNFDLFLFPNNKENGEIENLLLELINNDYSDVLECYQLHIECVSKNNRYTVPNNKSRVYAYIFCVLQGNERNHRDQGDLNYLNNDIWKLDNPALNPLSDFLSKYFQ